jgi:hypothetical protein
MDEMDNVDSSFSPADVGLPENSALSTSTSQNTQPPDDLPAGWASPESHSGFYRVPVIIVFALTLTLIITVLIASCALLRRKRRLRRLSLLQKEVSSELEQGSDGVDDSFWMKRIRRQKRSWARSSARWKSNAQLAMRRRRVRNSVTLSSTTLTIPTHPIDSLGGNSDIASSRDMQETLTSRLTSLPPAYPTRNAEIPSSESSTHPGERPSENSPPKRTSSIALATNQCQALPPTSFFGAHLATDDKALLELMASKASAPDAQEASENAPQAPDWIEVEEENEAIGSSGTSQLLYPLPGSRINPTILSVYPEIEDIQPTPLVPSSPHGEESLAFTIPSAPPIEED